MKKLITLVLLIESVQSIGQVLNERISIDFENGSIERALKSISDQSNIQFLYDNYQIDVTRQITLHENSQAIEQYLDQIFKGDSIIYIEKGRRIILKKKTNGTIENKARKATINGYLRDRESGENLIGGNVVCIDDFSGTSTNVYGFYSITLPMGWVNMNFSYVGYESFQQSFPLQKDTTINIELSIGTELEEIVVTSTKIKSIQETTEMGTIRLSSKQIKSRPTLGGEVDVFKVLQLMPGVHSGHEGSAGLYVRGGGQDQNLILLDGVPIYNASHLFGFLSVFNADAINNIKLIKGAFPARYGGRLSSVVDINMKEGNDKELHGAASFGLVASRITLEGPLKKDKTSFIFSGRRTLADLLAQPILNTESSDLGVTKKQKTNYFFYDFNTKINHKISETNRIYFSAYAGKDKGSNDFDKKEEIDGSSSITSKTTNDSDLKWGSAIALLRWNHVINPKIFSNLSLSFSEYQFSASNKYFENTVSPQDTVNDFQSYKTSTGIRDWAAKMDFDYLPHPSHYVRFGAQAIHHNFEPNVVGQRSSGVVDTTFNSSNITSQEYAFFLEDDFSLTTKVKANIGTHISGFQVNGKFYHSIQPRVSLRYLINDDLSIKASYTEMTQFLHLLTNPSIGLPTDLWVPATDRVKPQESKQSTLGLAYTHPRHGFEATVEGYYKMMDNLIEYKEGAGFLRLDENWQDKIEIGDGLSYGIEFFISKKFLKTEGWVGYTLAWANRKFDNLNFGKTFPFKFDRRHDVNVVVTHNFNQNIVMSANWVFGTGNSITLPRAIYLVPGPDRPDLSFPLPANAFYYKGRNDFRMRSQHRLDLNLNFIKKKKWGERAWVVSVYNAYSRRNTFYIEQRPTRDFNQAGKPVRFQEFTLFPIIPSVNYRIKF